MSAQVPKRLKDHQYNRVLEICRAKQGELLSGTEVKGRRITLKCQYGHIWTPDVYNVLKGSWCGHPECVSRSIARGKVAPILRSKTEKLLDTIRASGGHWVAGDYINNRTPISVRCAKGHTFNARPNDLLAGQWCARCAGKFPKDEAILRLQEYAQHKGGKLLSTEYKDIKTKLQFQCGKGHPPWWARPESILRLNTWCPKCAPNGVKLDEEVLAAELKDCATLQGGALLRLEVGTSSSGLQYNAHLECAAGHRWVSRSYHVLKGSWCPLCRGPGVKEKICRAILEHLTGKSFGKRRPDWLRNSRGRKMELDGYNEELRIAFEYQGEQHSRRVPFFHREDGEFEKRVEDDRLKRQLCRRNEVTLLVVDIGVPLEGLQTHLAQLLQKLRPDIARSLNSSNLDIATVQTGKETDLQRLEEIAASNGGTCLTEQYISSNTKMRFQCSEGHLWDAMPSSIIGGTWCPACAGNKISATKRANRDLAPLLSIITGHGGTLLAESAAGAWALLVECRKGHKWTTSPARLRKGHWCQKCSSRKRAAKLKLGIEELQSTALQRGGALLSRYYVKSSTKYLWECRTGHIWTASANNIRKGSWCPVCAGKPKFAYRGSIEEFLAAEKAAAESKLAT